ELFIAQWQHRFFFRGHDHQYFWLAKRISTCPPPCLVIYLSRFLPGFDECIATRAETLLRTLRSPWLHIALTGFKGQRHPSNSTSKNASLSLPKIQLRANSRLSLSSRRSATNEAGLPGKYNRLVKVQHRLRSTPAWDPVWERWGQEH